MHILKCMCKCSHTFGVRQTVLKDSRTIYNILRKIHNTLRRRNERVFYIINVITMIYHFYYITIIVVSITI